METFTKSEPELTSICINSSMNIFEKILKNIGLGQYEYLFNNCQVDIRSIDEPWFILMSLGHSLPQN